MSIKDVLANGFRNIAVELDALGEPSGASPNQRSILIRESELELKPYKWTPVPMEYIYGGNPELWQGGYIRGVAGYWLYGAYLRFSPNDEGQGVIRFVRDVGGAHDYTGTQDWVTTPGRDYVSHVWFFDPIDGGPTGFEVYNGSPGKLTLEYAQLKGVQIQL